MCGFAHPTMSISDFSEIVDLEELLTSLSPTTTPKSNDQESDATATKQQPGQSGQSLAVPLHTSFPGQQNPGGLGPRENTQWGQMHRSFIPSERDEMGGLPPPPSPIKGGPEPDPVRHHQVRHRTTKTWRPHKGKYTFNKNLTKLDPTYLRMRETYSLPNSPVKALSNYVTQKFQKSLPNSPKSPGSNLRNSLLDYSKQMELMQPLFVNIDIEKGAFGYYKPVQCKEFDTIGDSNVTPGLLEVASQSNPMSTKALVHNSPKPLPEAASQFVYRQKDQVSDVTSSSCASRFSDEDFSSAARQICDLVLKPPILQCNEAVATPSSEFQNTHDGATQQDTLPEGAQRILLECTSDNSEKVCAPQQGTLPEGAQRMLLECTSGNTEKVCTPQQGTLPEGEQRTLIECVPGNSDKTCAPQQGTLPEGAQVH